MGTRCDIDADHDVAVLPAESVENWARGRRRAERTDAANAAAPVMWSLSGSWIGSHALCATCSQSWSSSGKPERDSVAWTEAIDTTTPAGRMMMQMVGAFAEFERAMLRERTQAGVDAARQQGRVGGRRPKLSPQQQSEIRKMVSEGDKTAAARLFKVHPATVSRLLDVPLAGRTSRGVPGPT